MNSSPCKSPFHMLDNDVPNRDLVIILPEFILQFRFMMDDPISGKVHTSDALAPEDFVHAQEGARNEVGDPLLQIVAHGTHGKVIMFHAEDAFATVGCGAGEGCVEDPGACWGHGEMRD